MSKEKQLVVTPDAFVKEVKCEKLESVYDWNTQKNPVMASGTFRQTFSNPIQFEND